MNHFIDFLSNPILLLALTFAVYLMAKILQKRTRYTVLNPILVSIIVIILYLKMAGVEYETYHQSTSIIDFWLKPAVVALGIPLYRQMSSIKRQMVPILLSQLVGCAVGITSVVATAWLTGASREVIVSLAPKSVTTPIAMEIASSVGGIPPLTASVVVFVGLFGAVFGFRILKIGHIWLPASQGLSMGTASHAVGTSTAMEHSDECGAYASVGLILNGILTALLTPILLKLMGLL